MTQSERAGAAQSNVETRARTQVKKTILVVDDNELVLGSVRARLEDAGYEVWSVETAEHALDLLHEQAVDLVVTDYRLPGMDGLSFLERLTALRRSGPARSVIYSASPKPSGRLELTVPEPIWIPKSAGHRALLDAIRWTLEDRDETA